jgi:hypothetical protein
VGAIGGHYNWIAEASTIRIAEAVSINRSRRRPAVSNGVPVLFRGEFLSGQEDEHVQVRSTKLKVSTTSPLKTPIADIRANIDSRRVGHKRV